MIERQLRIRAVVGVAAAAAALLVWLSASNGSGPGGRECAGVAILAALTALCRVFPLHVAPRRKMSMDSAPMFAAALLAQPWLAALAAAAAIAAAESSSFFRLKGEKRRLLGEQVVFNAAQSCLAVVAAAWVFRSLHGGALAHWQPEALVAGLAAGLAMFAVNDAVLASIVVAQVGRKVLRTWFVDRGDIVYDAALYASGFVIAIAGGVGPLLLLLIAFPVAVFQRAMSDHVALRVQTRESIVAMADLIDARDHYTFEHSKRVGEYAREICGELDLSPDLVEDIVLAARVHDIGKICIRDNVLLKPGRLDEGERTHMREHPELGARMMVALKDFRRGTTYIRHHHERWDGGGYPGGLEGKAIPLGARIVSVADTFDAITTTRVYREGLPDGWARLEMAKVAGSQLDPDIVRAFFRSRGWTWPDGEDVAHAGGHTLAA
jgi:HD-GYP domain-containing protein (c-di-GMP phosphodiesterase class II)